MDKREAVEKVKDYAKLISAHFPVRLVVLYGSYAKGAIKKHSDIDVAVVVDRIGEDFLMSEAKLYRLRREIDERIEPVLLEEDNDISGFLEEILKTGEVVYAS